MSSVVQLAQDTDHLYNLDHDVTPAIDYSSFLSIVTNMVPKVFKRITAEPSRVTYRHIITFVKGNKATMSFVMCGNTFSCEHTLFTSEDCTGTSKYYILVG